MLPEILGRHPTGTLIVELRQDWNSRSDWGSLREAHILTFRVFIVNIPTQPVGIGNLINKI